MTEEKQLELVRKYPKILKDFRGDMKHTCMAWGVDTGDGWYNLLDVCMEKIQHYCNLASASGVPVQVIADQIKEKYGTLRFYFHLESGSRLDDDIIDDFISDAERASSHTCEETGDDRGALCRRGGWYRTLCRKIARQEGYIAVNEQTEEYWQTLDKELDEHNKLCSETQSNSAVG